jgi:hypothetical protein
MMKCENIIDFDEVYYRSEDNNFLGLLIVTDFMLYFKFKDLSIHHKTGLSEEYFRINLFNIQK